MTEHHLTTALELHAGHSSIHVLFTWCALDLNLQAMIASRRAAEYHSTFFTTKCQCVVKQNYAYCTRGVSIIQPLTKTVGVGTSGEPA